MDNFQQWTEYRFIDKGSLTWWLTRLAYKTGQLIARGR